MKQRDRYRAAAADSPAVWVLDPDTLPVTDLAAPIPAFKRSGKAVAAAARTDSRTFRTVQASR